MAKKKKTRSSHPMMFYIYLTILVIIVSAIASALNFQVTYDKLTLIAGEVSSTTVTVNSLFSLDGLKFILTSSIDNLKDFAPFASLLVSSIALGVAFNSGFIKSLISKISKKIPKYVLVFLYSLFCILLSIDGNTGYVILIPLGALLFMALNRNPLGGLALGFASTAAGYSTGLFLTAVDYNLASYTDASAKLVLQSYNIAQNGNLIFIIVCSLLISIICTFITEKLVVRKLGRNQIEEETEIVIDEKIEKKGIIWSLIVTFILLVPIVLMIIPSSKEGFIGLLLDKSQSDYIQMIYSSDALFLPNLINIISLILLIQGFIYGVITGAIKKIRDIVSMSSNYIKSIGSIFLIIFFAAQFVSILRESNLGVVLTGFFANLISNSNFSFIPLILMLFIFTFIANIILPGTVAKWSILAPNIIPAFMNANVNPEFTQLIYRAGESCSGFITPALPFFVIFIGFVEIYTKNKSDFSIKKCYSLLLPYLLTIVSIWLVLILCWYVIGLPIGPITNPMMK